jgi:signal transduction histidine kinase
MGHRSTGLIIKTTLVYLVFILLAFFATAAFIIERTNQFIDNDTEQYFQRKERHILNKIAGNQDTAGLETKGLKMIDGIYDSLRSFYPVYRDTTLSISQVEETILFRIKTVLVDSEKGVFQYTMYKNINDFDVFRQGVMRTIMNTFVILTLVLTLFSLFLSGFLFRPFHKILGIMDRYEVGDGIEVPDVNTTTAEFKNMQALFVRMIERIENDYRKLKEYTENIAHEMQTSLAIILSKVEVLISDEKVMKSKAPTVKSIYDEANHLSKLGNTLNLLTKIENGEYNKVVRISTAENIARHIETVKDMFELKKVALDIDLNPHHTFDLDPFLFDIMLKNLVRNALCYSTNKGPVTIKTGSKSMEISNFGDPLKFDSSEIFNRFVGSFKSKSRLGLGLALVKQICDLNNLSISYKYNNGKHIFNVLPVE